MPERQNPIVNRLNKTKVEKEVDHEQERIERLRVEANQRKAAAAEKVLSPISQLLFFWRQLTPPISNPCRNVQMLNWRRSGKLRSRPGLTILSSTLPPARNRQQTMTFGTMKMANLTRLGPRNLRISFEKAQRCFHHSDFVYSCLVVTEDGIQSGGLAMLGAFCGWLRL